MAEITNNTLAILVFAAFATIIAGSFTMFGPGITGFATSDTGNDNSSVSPPAPPVHGGDVTCLAKECVVPEPDIAPDISVPNDQNPATTIAPVISTVNVTGVKIASQVWYGFDGTTGTTYIVPMYSFSGTVTSVDNPGSPWTSDYIALDQSFIDSTTPPLPREPQPGEDPKVTIEPGTGVIEPSPGVIEPGTDAGAGSDATLGVEPSDTSTSVEAVRPVEPVEPVEPVTPVTP